MENVEHNNLETENARLKKRNEELQKELELLKLVNARLMHKIEALEVGEKGLASKTLTPSIEKRRYKAEEVLFNISRKEYEDVMNLPVNDEKDMRLMNWMKEKSINFESGDIIVGIGGEIWRMSTSKEDFGTLVDYE